MVIKEFLVKGIFEGKCKSLIVLCSELLNLVQYRRFTVHIYRCH